MNTYRLREVIDPIVSVTEREALEPAVKAVRNQDMHAGSELLEHAETRRRMHESTHATPLVGALASPTPAPAPRALNGEAKVMLRLKADNIVAAHIDVDDLLVVGASELKRMAGMSVGLYDEFADKLRKRYAELANGRKLGERDARKAMGPRPQLVAAKGGASGNASGASSGAVLPLTQFGMAKRLNCAYPDRLKFVPTAGWLMWDDVRWDVLYDEQVNALAYGVIENLIGELSTIPDPEEQMKAIQRAEGLQNAGALTGTVTSLKAVPGVLTDWQLLNNHREYLSARNGAILLAGPDAGTVVWKRDLMVTMKNDTVFDAEAKCPKFLQALADTFENREEDIAYYELIMGYSIQANPAERAMFFHKGEGRRPFAMHLVRTPQSSTQGCLRLSKARSWAATRTVPRPPCVACCGLALAMSRSSRLAAYCVTAKSSCWPAAAAR